MRAWVRALVQIHLSIGFATAVHASTWVELSSPGFVVVTDAGEQSARELVMNLEQLDGAIAAFAPTGGALRIYLFRSEAEFAEFRNEGWVAGMTLTPANHGAPVVLVFDGPAVRETALHEYVHALVKRGDWKLPHWFEEGLAELYAHSSRVGRDQLSIGRGVPEHLGLLKNRAIQSAWFVDDEQRGAHGQYYAASWAIVHMLLMEPGNRSLTERLLADGGWDASFPQLLKELQAYVGRPVWKEATVSAPRPEAVEWGVKPIAALDVEFMLASLALDAGRPEAARKRYKKIAAGHPKDAVGAEAEGFAALADGRMEAAREKLRRAATLGTTRARVWSELAALDGETSETKILLERAWQLDSSDYRAAFLLGVRESDDGEFELAAGHLGAAVRAAPGQADVWHAYALALSKAGRLGEARVAAQRMLRVASSPEWERMAAELVGSLERGPEIAGPALRRKPEVVTSPAWTGPVADAEVSGRFLEFVCDGAGPPRIRIEVEGGKVVDLTVGDARQVKVRTTGSGESSMDLKCGQQDGRPIVVGFRRIDSTVLELKFPQVHDLQRF